MRPLTRYVFIVMAVAVALRVGYALTLPNHLLYPDEESYDLIARNFAATGVYGVPQPTGGRTPGYTVFLAGVYWILGASILRARIVQALLSAWMVWLVYRLGVRWLQSERAALAASLIAAVYPFFIFYDAKLLSDGWVTLWMVAWLLATDIIQQKPDDLWRWAAWGFSAMVVCLTKIALMPAAALVLGIEILRYWRAATPGRAIRAVAVALLVWAGPILFWGFRNARDFGRFTLDTHGGVTMIETIVFHEETKAQTYNTVWATHPWRPQVMAIQNEALRDEYCRRLVSEYIRADRLRYLRQCLVRLKDFWRFYPRPDIQFREGAQKLIFVSLATEPFLILFGFWGLWATRRRWFELYPAYLAIGLLTLAHTLVSGQMRYRLPVMPILILMSMYTVFSLPYVRNLRNR
jgi:4-amino-4-deoxy-L-arabinose transferase-like glycosyltransferase